MGTITPINPQVIYVSAIEPTDKTEGKIWYNTSDNSLYTSDGSSYVSAEPDVDYLNGLIQEQSLQILINSASATSTLNDWDTMDIDIFTDATGLLDTIDTSETTAIFLTDQYVNSENGTFLDATQTGLSDSGTYLLKFTYSDINALVSEGRNYCHVSNPEAITCKWNFLYSDETSADVEQTAQPSATKTFTNPNPEKMVTEIKIYFKTTNYNGYIKDQTYDYVIPATNRVIQTEPASVETGAVSCQLYGHNETAGTGNITFDISTDGGSTYTTGLPINQKRDITSTTGTSMITKLNLNGVGEGNNASLKDYSMMLFY